MKITLTLDCELVLGDADAEPSRREILTAVFVQCPVPSIVYQADVDDGWQLQIKNVNYEIKGEK